MQATTLANHNAQVFVFSLWFDARAA